MTRAKRVQAAKLVQRSRANEDAFLSSLCIITFYAAHVYANSCILKSRIRPPNLSRNSRAAADPRGTSQIEARTALRTRVANFSTSSTSLDNINFHGTRTINSHPRRFRCRQTTKHEDEDTRKEIVDGFLRERRRGNTTRKYERFYYWWLAESYIFERNNSIAHESDGILNGGEYVRDGRIADYIP